MRTLPRRLVPPLSGGGAGDEGFTMIEVVVALGLLAVAIPSMAMVFYAGLRTAATSKHRTDGSALATRALEAMHAVPYAQLGFYADQTGYVATFQTHTTVVLGATTPTGVTPQVTPVDPAASVLDGVSFAITRQIAWVDAPGSSSCGTATSFLSAYKQLTVLVHWADQVGAHDASQSTDLYPGGLGCYAGAAGGTVPSTTTTTIAAPVPPSVPVVSLAPPPASPADQTEIDLSWTQPPGGGAVASYYVQYTTDPTFAPANVVTAGPISPTATSYRVQPLSAATSYILRLVASGPGSTSATSNAVSRATATAPPPCNIGSLTMTGATSNDPAKTYLDNGNKMSEDIKLSLTTSGTCTGVFTVSGADPSGAADPDTPYTLTGALHTGTISSSGEHGWAVGVHTFTVLQNTVPVSPPVAHTFTVCSKGTIHAGPSC